LRWILFFAVFFESVQKLEALLQSMRQRKMLCLAVRLLENVLAIEQFETLGPRQRVFSGCVILFIVPRNILKISYNL